jgi:hypothetical protein
VVAQLGFALDLDPVVLMVGSLRSVGRHVLLVLDDRRDSPLQLIKHIADPDVDVWVESSSRSMSMPHAHHIQLRRGRASTYQPRSIAASLSAEITKLQPMLERRRVGMVFSEMSEAMSTLRDPTSVIRYEQDWADVVTQTAARAEAHLSWNVCAYTLPALVALPNATSAVESLIASHDTILMQHEGRLRSGDEAATTLLATIANG